MTHGKTGLQSTAERLSRELASGLDLTDADQLRLVDVLTNSLLEAAARESLGVDSLKNLEFEFSRRDEVPLMLHLAIKLARSRLVCAEIARPLRVSVVFAMYKEHNRILPAERHPHGEDFLVRKVAQMDRLLSDVPQIEWQLIAVDDGCPEGSGRLAEEIIEQQGLGQWARVLYLEEAIRDRLPVTSPMTSTAESQKGGAIAYGMWDASQSPHPNHVVVFTDADLSTHLGQVGLLLEVIESGADVAIGSRREPESVVVKAGGRNSRGKLFIYLWKRLLEPLGYIVDTQCGFKAFTGDAVRSLVGDLHEKRFAIDLELLLRSELRRPGSIEKVPIAWIDSDAASTTTDIQPYLPMLQTIVTLYRRHLTPDAAADAFADFIEQLDDAAWARLLENVPSAIAEGDPADFHRGGLVSVAELREEARRAP